MFPRVLILAAALLAVAPQAVLCLEDPPPAGPAPRWDSPILLVSDLEAAVEWYERVLGFERVGDRVDGTSRTVVLSRGPILLSLRPLAVDVTGSVAPRKSLRPSITLLVDDVDGTIAALADQGVAVLSSPKDEAEGRDRLATILDPDGNRLILREPLPRGS